MPRAIFFAPCLVDQVYPEIGVALVKLLSHLGFDVSFKQEITCCGQPAFNAGQVSEARAVARTVVKTLSESDARACEVVCPSGSCTAMMRRYYPEVFEGDRDLAAASDVGSRVFELSEFLKRHGLLGQLRGTYKKRVAFHNSCHTARELELRCEYRDLFKGIDGLELLEPSAETVCCGFGGLFCQKFTGISEGMALTRLEMCRDVGADEIVSNDPGCIMHLRLMSDKLGFKLPVRHTVEVLAEAVGVA